jgi:hypothetical protein
VAAVAGDNISADCEMGHSCTIGSGYASSMPKLT